MSPADEIAAKKAEIRRESLARRRLQPEPEATSAAILGRLFQRPEYVAARSILFYVSARSEVQTHRGILAALADDKIVAVPYCVGAELEIFRLDSFADLELGAYGIHEPRAELRSSPAHQIDLMSIDLIIVPGVAFDPCGSRLGHGLGYYDRLLALASPATKRIALAYECQIWPEIPAISSDVPMDVVLTEERAYERLDRAVR